MYNNDNVNIFFIITFLVFCSLLCVVKCTPMNQKSAEMELDSFLKEWNIDAGKRDCQYSDSDGNGYVTCQYYDNKKQEIVEVECAGQLNFNHGCKTYKSSFMRRQRIHL